MVFNRPLQNIYGHAVHLEQFFNEVLGVRDAGILDVLYHLRLSSDLNSLSQMNSESIYRYLEESARTEKDWERIR
jgi:hypothetical protein